MQLLAGRIQKTDADKRLVFGFAYVAKAAGGAQVTDHSGDEVDPANLEDVAYDYVLESREGGEMHVAKGVSRLVESFVVTVEKLVAIGIPADVAKTAPAGWWVGFRVDDDAVWKSVKEGKYTMFSIGGVGAREEIADAE